MSGPIPHPQTPSLTKPSVLPTKSDLLKKQRHFIIFNSYSLLMVLSVIGCFIKQLLVSVLVLVRLSFTEYAVLQYFSEL